MYAARADRRQEEICARGHEQEKRVRRRLFEGGEQSVRRGRVERVGRPDDGDASPCLERGERELGEQRACAVDAYDPGPLSVQPRQVRMRCFDDEPTGAADAACVVVLARVRAQPRRGESCGERLLARSAGPVDEVGVREAIRAKGCAQGGRDASALPALGTERAERSHDWITVGSFGRGSCARAGSTRAHSAAKTSSSERPASTATTVSGAI